MIKNKTLKEVHNYFIEILGFDEKSSDAALNNKYKKMTEIKSTVNFVKRQFILMSEIVNNIA
jgi:hypothetical protein